jgi:phosphoribosylformylglycinamidine cyclo-ligase
MPGLYQPGDFDLAGTIVGMVDVDHVPNPARVVAGDAIVGLPSIGLHTNGYTLARSVIPEAEWETLLAPHPSYYETVRAIQQVADVKAMAHITGGGLLDNVPRTLPPGCKAIFEQTRWQVPPVIADLVRRANLGHEERYRTLNMGIGYTLIVPLSDAAKAVGAAPQAKVIGWIETRGADDPAVVIHPARE